MKGMPAAKAPADRAKAMNLLIPGDVNRKLDECQGMLLASGLQPTRLSKQDTINLAIEFLWTRLKRTRDKVRRAIGEVEKEAGREKKNPSARIAQGERSRTKLGQDAPRSSEADSSEPSSMAG